jgi:two-component sensor histidine kinase
LLILTVIALAPAVGLLGWTEFQLRQAREVEIRELAARYGQLASLELVRIVDGINSLLLAIAPVPAVADLTGDACDAYLARVVTDAPQLAALVSFDGNGTQRCASRTPAPVLSDANRTFLTAVPEQQRLIVGLFQDGVDAGHPVLPLIMPLHDVADSGSHALVAYLDLGWLGDRLRERALGAGNSLTISDRAGTIIAREPLPQRFIGTRIPPAFDRLIHATAPGTEHVISQDGTSRMLGYYPVTVPPVGIYLSAGVSEQEAFRDIDSTRARNFEIILLTGLATFALAWFIGQRFIQRPVNRLLACIAAWRHGDYAARTGMVGRSGELESVGEAFDQLIQELTVRQAASEHAEAQRQLLVDELTHRVKNTLTLVQAIAAQSLRGTGAVADARETFQLRLRALADAHDVLTSNNWEAADLRDVLERTLLPYRDGWPERFVMSGPDLLLQSRAALAVGLAVHELATNAAKYGALTAERGQVLIAWEIIGDAQKGRFHLSWIERGGPEVSLPLRTGFGSRLIQNAFSSELNGTVNIDYEPEGLTCMVDADLRAVAAEFA